MSYVKSKTGDSLNDWFSDMSDFVPLSEKLLHSQTAFEFQLWFEKLRLVNARALYLFLLNHKNEIPPEYLLFVEPQIPNNIKVKKEIYSGISQASIEKTHKT